MAAPMPVDFVTLLHRDHADLQRELTQLLDPEAHPEELRTALDGVRLGLTAHAEAEDIVLGRFAEVAPLAALLARISAAHAVQERVLGALVRARPHTVAWRDRARELRLLVATDAAVEEQLLLRALERHAPAELAPLAGAFATERLRQLAQLQPSAPVDLARPARGYREVAD